MGSAISLLPLLPQLLLLLFALLILLYDLGHEDRAGLGGLALLGPVAALLSLPLLALHPGEFWGQMWRIDGFSLFFQALLYVATGLVILLSREYVRHRPLHRGEFYALLLLATIGTSAMASSAELLTIYIGLELLSLASYALVGLLKQQESSVEAALKYFLIGAVASAILLFGISLLFGLSGTTYLPDLANALAYSPGASHNPLLIAAIVLVLTGFGFKASLVPLHMWTPDVYEGAPTPITAFLAAGSKAAAFAGLLRLLVVGLPAALAVWQPLLTVVAVVTMTFGNLTALVQTNVKRLMGYSAIAQAGYILTGLVVFTPTSLAAALYYLMVYVFMNIGVLAVIIRVAEQEGSVEISSFRGLGQKHPFYAISLALFFLGLVGIPPTGGFMGKLALFYGAVQTHYTWLAVVMVANSVVSFAYYYGVVRQVWLERPTVAARAAPPGSAAQLGGAATEPDLAVTGKVAGDTPLTAATGGPGRSRGLTVAVAVALVALLLLGLYPEPFWAWVQAVAAGL